MEIITHNYLQLMQSKSHNEYGTNAVTNAGLHFNIPTKYICSSFLVEPTAIICTCCLLKYNYVWTGGQRSLHFSCNQ